MKNSKRILAAALAAAMCLSCAPMTAGAVEDIEVTVRLRAPSIAADLTRLYDDLTAVGIISDESRLPADIVVTVPEGATVQQVLQAVQSETDTTFEGLDSGYVTAIGFVGNEMLGNLTDTELGNYLSGNVFSSAGWSFAVDGQDLQSGIATDTVTDGAVVAGEYDLYGTWNGAESRMEYYDAAFVNAYDALAALAEQTVDTSAFSADALAAYQGARQDAQSLLRDIYDAATLDDTVAEMLQEAYSDFHTAGGMWIGYIEEQGTSLWGPGSPTEQLQTAAARLQKGIDNELVVEESARCDLTALSIARYSNDAVQTLTPAFNRAVTAYAIDAEFPNSEVGFEVKLETASEDAVVTTYVNGVRKGTVASGQSSWTFYYNSLQTGENTIAFVVAASAETDAPQKTYTVRVTRERSSTATLASGTALGVTGRDKSTSLYLGKAEGTLFRTAAGALVPSGSAYNTSFSGSYTTYRAFFFGGASGVTFTPTLTDANAHVRVSANGGEPLELTNKQASAPLLFDDDGRVTLTVEVVSEKTYAAHGFAAAEQTYTIEAETIATSSAAAAMLTAACAAGDWYPAFAPTQKTYSILMPNGTTGDVLTYTAVAGATVKVDANVQTPDENGTYTLPLTDAAQTVKITSADGTISSDYRFQLLQQAAGAPDAVVDYLPINSQYTNGSYGLAPETTLAGSLKSLGGFGGYVTYYYEEALTDSDTHPYGLDFFVYGNSSESNQASMAEPGQVWVSEDGETFYALAGSEHYEKTTRRDYRVTYTRTADGKTAWVDNEGNQSGEKSGAWPLQANYPLHDFGTDADTITLGGILLPSRQGTATGDGTTAAYAAETRFGYADYYANGTIGAAVNPYVAAPRQANGFDLAWAVDENGDPAQLDAVHYVKVVTASNIWAGAFNDKSTEVARVLRASDSAAPIGQTEAPVGVTLTDAAGDTALRFTAGQTVYSAAVGDKKYLRLSVDGAAADDNIYVNNQRISADGAAAITVTETEPATVRVLLQNGEKEPILYVLHLTSTASDSNDLIEGVYAQVGGVTRAGVLQSDGSYRLTVGNAIDSISLTPRVGEGVSYTIDGAAPVTAYPLAVGENTFLLAATDGLETQQARVVVVRQTAGGNGSSGTIRVSVTVRGDTLHGAQEEKHTAANGNLITWLPRTNLTLSVGATAKEALRRAMDDAGLTYTLAGNYFSAVNGLAEFDNGVNAGWMYTVNGKYPSLGVAEQTLQNGDEIVLHYTDDYTAESDAKLSGGGSGGAAGIPAAPSGETASTPAPNTFYSDVPQDSYYADAVRDVTERGLMQGVGDECFAPEKPMTRAMLVTVLYRQAGESASAESLPFADVAENDWFASAVRWGVATQIVKGVAPDRFAPMENVTREQLAVYLWRTAGSPQLADYEALGRYADVSAISDWAYAAMQWAHEQGIMQGGTDGCLHPADAVTRADAAVMLTRYNETRAA